MECGSLLPLWGRRMELAPCGGWPVPFENGHSFQKGTVRTGQAPPTAKREQAPALQKNPVLRRFPGGASFPGGMSKKLFFLAAALGTGALAAWALKVGAKAVEAAPPGMRVNLRGVPGGAEPLECGENRRFAGGGWSLLHAGGGRCLLRMGTVFKKAPPARGKPRPPQSGSKLPHSKKNFAPFAVFAVFSGCIKDKLFGYNPASLSLGMKGNGHSCPFPFIPAAP